MDGLGAPLAHDNSWVCWFFFRPLLVIFLLTLRFIRSRWTVANTIKSFVCVDYSCLSSFPSSFPCPIAAVMGLLECLLSDQHVVDLMQNKWPSVDPRARRSGPDFAISTKSIQNQCRISGGAQSAISIFFPPARDTCLIMPFRRPPLFAPDCLCLRRKSFVSSPGLIKQSERSFNVFPLVSVKALEGFIRPEKLWIVWRSFVRCAWAPRRMGLPATQKNRNLAVPKPFKMNIKTSFKMKEKECEKFQRELEGEEEFIWK